MGGWIKVYRKFLDSSIFLSKDVYLIQLWIYLLLKVNHKENKFLFNGQEIIVKKGSGIFGLNQIVKDLSKEKREGDKKFRKLKTIYYRRLKILENIGNVKLKPTNKYTLIEIINWDRYQENETQLKLKRNSTETQLKTNKNDNNDNNEKNISKDIGKPISYGNSSINECISYLENKIGGSLDGSVKENRQYCYNLLRKLKKDYPDINEVENVKLLIDTAYQDRFHSRNITGFKYLYYNTQRIAQSFKNDYGLGDKSDIQTI